MNLFVKQLAAPWDSGTLSEKHNALNYLVILNPKPRRNNGGETRDCHFNTSCWNTYGWDQVKRSRVVIKLHENLLGFYEWQ